MLQLVYISTTCGNIDLSDILRVSRRNNARDGVTGLLYHDGRRFLQALEGDADDVAAAFNRIKLDPRHRAMVILSRRTVACREFGPWQMADRNATERAQMIDQVGSLLVGASPAVRGTFEGFMQVKRAA